MKLYGIIYLYVNNDEITYPYQHEKAFVTEEEQDKAFEEQVDAYWKDACEKNEDLNPERKDEFYDFDEWHYTDCYGDEFIIKKTYLEIDVDGAEIVLRKAYCESMHNMMQVYVPGYKSCRLAMLDMRGQCLSFEWCMLPNGDRERLYIDLICNMPDGSQTVIGHTINNDYSPKKYEALYTRYISIGELKKLHDASKEAYKNNEQRLRAWNPFWLLKKNNVSNLLDYMNTPYDEYLEDIKNDKKHG